MRTSRSVPRPLVIIIMIAAVLIAGTVSAAPVWHTSKIKWIYPLSSGAVILTFEIESPTCNPGATTNYHLITVGENGVTQEALENMLAVALTAATTGRAVSINFDDATTYCYINRLYVRFDS